MKISDLKNVQQLSKIERARAAKSDDGEGRGSISDRVDLSAAAEMQGLTELAMQKPVDEMEFTELKAAIRNGDYQPDLGAVADRLMADPVALEALIAE